MNNKIKNFIIASSKPWHKLGFDRLFKKNNNYCWSYVSTPNELDLALKKVINPRYLFFLHWNWKLSPAIFQKYECVCFHMTNLPYGRGGSPLQNLILEGNKKTMLSAFKMNEEIDAGPIYDQKPMLLNGKAEDIYKRSGELSWKMINSIIENEPVPEPQKGNPVYFSRRNPSQSLLPVEGKVSQIYDYIRMLDAPTYPLAFINHGNFIIEFSDSELKGDIVSARVIIKKKK
ncbi:MAG: methionyl-tRNA formyltransferase [Flavobacteriales bacterium]|nr:methionyl-tRNA formyltransferase [Flavobacteriales bacterium]